MIDQAAQIISDIALRRPWLAMDPISVQAASFCRTHSDTLLRASLAAQFPYRNDSGRCSRSSSYIRSRTR